MNKTTTTNKTTNTQLNAEFIREYLKLSPRAQACVYACMQSMAAIQDGKQDDAGAWLAMAKFIMPRHAKRFENLVNG